MKFRAHKALARGVLLETVRRKDLWVVAILGFLIMLAAGTLGVFGMRGLEAFAKDLGVNVLGAFSTVIGVLVSSRLMPEEIKQRTLYPLLARPITRFDLLVGKLIGAVAATWLAFLILAATTALGLAVFHAGLEPIMVQYLFLKMVGLAVLCAVTLSMSLVMTPSAAATLSFILAFGSGMMGRALVMASGPATPSIKMLYQAMYAMLPQYGLFDIGGRVANSGWSMAPAWVCVALIAYGSLYSSGVLVLGWLKFRARAV